MEISEILSTSIGKTNLPALIIRPYSEFHRALRLSIPKISPFLSLLLIFFLLASIRPWVIT